MEVRAGDMLRTMIQESIHKFNKKLAGYDPIAFFRKPLTYDGYPILKYDGDPSFGSVKGSERTVLIRPQTVGVA